MMMTIAAGLSASATNLDGAITLSIQNVYVFACGVSKPALFFTTTAQGKKGEKQNTKKKTNNMVFSLCIWA